MLAVIALAIITAGCSGGGGADTSEDEPPDRLLVTRDDGRGARIEIRLECERGDRARCQDIAHLLPGLRPDPDVVCAEIFRGPERIEIVGRLGGEAVEVAVGRADACADERYQRLDAVLSP